MSLIDRLASARVLAILRMDDVAGAGVRRALRLHGAGVRAFECTLDRPGALDAIARLRRDLGDDSLVGAGTVTEASQVDSLVDLGADFAVTPHLDDHLVEYSLASGLPMIPGVMTPSEIAAAFRLDVPGVKLFPAGRLGIPYLRDLQGPFGSFPVIPTGSIRVAEVAAWLEAGAVCVGLGSALTVSDRLPPELGEALR